MHLAAKLDDIGKPAWIALMIVSFIIWWPIGLAVMGFLYWSGRMGCGQHGRNWEERCQRWREARGQWREARHEWRETRRSGFRGMPSSGNMAFDDYRAQILKKLRDEQREFWSFLERLRYAKDKAEFDQFMAERETKRPEGEADQTPVQS